MATTRARLNPDSPAGWAQPRMRSSTSEASSAGTLAMAALTMWAPKSSGRQSTRDPLLARPIGVRAVETMTASGMAPKLPPTSQVYFFLAARRRTLGLKRGEHRRGLTPRRRKVAGPGPLDGRPDALLRPGHVEVVDAEMAEGVDHGVLHRRRGAHAGRFADSLGPELV